MSYIQGKVRNSSWYIDSACSGHMTGNRNWFNSLKEDSGGSITFGNESKGEVIGTGQVGISEHVTVEKVNLVNN